MTELTIQTQTVKVPARDTEIDAYLAVPEAEGNFPGVVVIQEVFGVNIHIREVTERLAKQGYIAIAPAFYQRSAPGYETGYSPEDLEQGRSHAMQTTVDQLLGDIQATIRYLRTLPHLKPVFGCIGFCFGGHVTYLAATLPEITAAASFYGAGIPIRTFGPGEPTITRTPEIKALLYCFFGREDPLIPQEHTMAIESALRKHQIPHQIFRYEGAGHGFFCDHRPDYNPTAAADAWQKVTQLFRSQLQGV